jgi:glutathione synthase/RimK-type ligase-like ATP-grasp enzyme
LTPTPRIVRDNETLSSCLHDLQAGDIISCRLRLKSQEEHILIDLMERGIKLFPSATSQLASRSKVFQARIFQSLMVPGTCSVYDIHGLLNALSRHQKNQTKHVVLKHDRKHGGLGIHLFKDPEDIFTLCANNVLPFPFVLQPFLADSRDIRVIILGDYIEAYQRSNPNNFRHNLYCGGKACRWELSRIQEAVCRTAMTRGAFPYAHIDLLLTSDDTVYLNEINLRGGIHGATITPRSYDKKITDLHGKALEEMGHGG